MKIKSIRMSVQIAILSVVMLSLIGMGTSQYLREVNLREHQIIDKSLIALQPVISLAARNIDGGNLMNLKNKTAEDLYKANSDLLYLKMSGMSTGSPKTEFSDEIPPTKIEYSYLKEGLTKESITEKEGELKGKEQFFDKTDYLLHIKKELTIKNGGNVYAVFSAKSLEGTWYEVLTNVLFVAFLVLIGSTVIATFVGGRIAKPIVTVAEQISQITESLDLSSKVRNHSLTFSSESAKVMNIVNEQSGQMERVATSVEESSATGLEIAKNSSNAAKSSENIKESVNKGSKVIMDTIAGMDVIAKEVSKNAEMVEQLGKRSEEIGEIISVIDDIAEQTNLLALNAAIEAA